MIIKSGGFPFTLTESRRLMTKQENMNREKMIKEEIKESREFYEKYNLANIDYIIVNREDPNTPYDKDGNGTPLIRWGGNMYSPFQLTDQNALRLTSVVAEVREKIKELGFVLEGNEETPYVDNDGKPFSIQDYSLNKSLGLGVPYNGCELPQVKEVV